MDYELWLRLFELSRQHLKQHRTRRYSSVAVIDRDSHRYFASHLAAPTMGAVLMGDAAIFLD